MKKFLIFSIICLPCIVMAQDRLISPKHGADTLYTASGFQVYVGQTLKIGVGAMPDGDFKYIRKNANSLFAYNSSSGYQGLANSANSFSRRGSGLDYKVIRIDTRGDKKHGYVYYPIINGGGRYEIDIDNAIAFGEVVVSDEFKPKPKALLVEMTQNVSVADELVKLKKLKDDGVITDEEFQTQKKKILDR